MTLFLARGSYFVFRQLNGTPREEIDSGSCVGYKKDVLSQAIDDKRTSMASVQEAESFQKLVSGQAKAEELDDLSMICRKEWENADLRDRSIRMCFDEDFETEIAADTARQLFGSSCIS